MGCPTNINHSYCEYNIPFNQGNYQHLDLGRTLEAGTQEPRYQGPEDLRNQGPKNHQLLRDTEIESVSMYKAQTHSCIVALSMQIRFA